MDYLLSQSRPPRSSSRHDINSINITAAESAQLAQPWTATRCHRLLRPLLTHIAALKKEKLRISGVSSGRTGGSEDREATGPAAKKRRNSPESASSSYYPEKRVCRKYTSKASRAALCTTTPQKSAQAQRRRVLKPKSASSRQEVVLPTPFLRRVKNHPLSSSPNRGPVDEELCEPPPAAAPVFSTRCSHPKTCCKGRCVFESELASLRTSIDQSRHALYVSVFRALDSLLRATSASKYPAPAAPRSLLAMCLRKVPDYIAELEYWEHKDAEEQGTKFTKQMSFEIYSELEGLNGASDGWRHLCAVVRAHGVRVIREAVAEDQLFEDVFTDLLIRVCLEYMPVRECMGLIDAYIQRPYPRPCAAEDSLFATPGLRPLRILKTCDAATSGPSILPTKLAELLSNDLLPGKWILTNEFKALWVSTAGLLIEKKHRQDVIDFTITTLSQMCDLVSNSERLAGRMKDNEQPWDKAQNTLTGAVAALTSITLLLQDGASSTRRVETVGKRVQFILDSCSRDQEDNNYIGAYLLSLCSYLAFKTDSALATIRCAWNRVRNAKGSEEWTRQYGATTVFVSSVAYYCSRGAMHSSPTDCFSRLCDELEMLQIPGDPLGNLRVDGAFSLAEQTGDLRDLAFAEGLRDKFKSKPKKSTDGEGRGQTHGDGDDETSFVGFRWDEGISEWVNVDSPAPEPARQSTRGPGVRVTRGFNLAPRKRKSSGYQEQEVGEAASATSENADYESSVSDDGDVTGSDYEDGEEDEGQGDVLGGETEDEGGEDDASLGDQNQPEELPLPGSEEEDDIPTNLSLTDDDNEQSESEPESETHLPTASDLLASTRLRHPKKLQPPSSPPSSPPRRRSIWKASTLDDELCFDDAAISSSPSSSRKDTAVASASRNNSSNDSLRRSGRRSTGSLLLRAQPRRKSSTPAGGAGTGAGTVFRRSANNSWLYGGDESSDADELSFC